MAKILCMITCMFIFFTCHMLSSEGRQIRSPSKVVTNYAKSPFHKDIRKLSSQIHKSDHSAISPKKFTPQKPSSQLFHTEINEKSFPSFKTHSSPNTHKTNFFWASKVNGNVNSNCPGVICTDDFRPTAPGKSPGAGHAFVTNTEKTSRKEPTKTSKVWNSIAVSDDAFKHTAPGRSPGAGHVAADKRDPKLTNAEVQYFFPSTSTPSSFFSESSLVSTNDFRPTSPGSSPGAGHSDTKQIGAEQTEDCLTEKCTDDFRPTTPGHSPGDGHSISNSDNFTSEQGKHPDVTNPHEEGTDDFRPTKPGHSPGAGHAVEDKAEP